MAAIGIDTGDHGHCVANFIHGDVEDALLLVKITRMNFRRMTVHGDGADTRDIGHIGQMPPGLSFIDFEVFIEGQQCGGDHALRHKILHSSHVTPVHAFGGPKDTINPRPASRVILPPASAPRRPLPRAP